MIPVDQDLYDKIKKEATRKFQSPSGIYRSSWIVREYKKRGGRYSGNKPKQSGLKRWYRERWIDLNRPIVNTKGKVIDYEDCGRSPRQMKSRRVKYPLCRPTYRITSKTPRTYKELTQKSISRAKRQKSRVRSHKNIRFI